MSPTLSLLALSPTLNAPNVPPSAAADDGFEYTAAVAFACWLMKIVIISAYCGVGACKLYHSFGVPTSFSYVLGRDTPALSLPNVWRAAQRL